MGLRGLEPPTSRLSGVRSNHLSYKPMLVSASGRRFRLPTPCGGDEEDRTPDPLLARQVLSQLSYTPIFGVPAFSSLRHNCRLPPDIPRFFVLLLALICFAAQVLSSDSFGICQRFFFEKAFVVGLSGLEPPTSRLSGVRSNRLSYRPILS